MSPSLSCTRQHCLVKSAPRASLGERGSRSPEPLRFSKKWACQWKSGVGSSQETGSGFFYSCTELVQRFVYFEGKMVSYSGVERSWLLDGFWWAFYTSFGAALCRGDKEKCCLTEIDASSSAPVLKQKGCDVVLTQAWETRQEQGQVMQTGFCGPGRTSSIPSGNIRNYKLTAVLQV